MSLHATPIVAGEMVPSWILTAIEIGAAGTAELLLALLLGRRGKCRAPGSPAEPEHGS